MKENTRTFYDDVLDEQNRQVMERARQVDGLDEDIALARTEVRDAMAEVNHDRRQVFQGLGILRELHLARFKIAGAPNPDLEEDLDLLAGRFDQGPLPLDGGETDLS